MVGSEKKVGSEIGKTTECCLLWGFVQYWYFCLKQIKKTKLSKEKVLHAPLWPVVENNTNGYHITLKKLVKCFHI